eukprot:30957-Pelagococcus_subviridis.AAC.27
MTVRSSHGAIHAPEQGLFAFAIFFTTRVFEVVRVDDADDVPELIRPTHAVVEPCQMFRLLQYRHVRVFVRHALGDIPHGNDATLVDRVPAGVKANIKRRVEVHPSREPSPDVFLLLLRVFEYRVRVHELLVTERQPRNHERDAARRLPAVSQVGCSEQRVNAGSSHPGQAGGRDDAEMPARLAQRRMRGRGLRS